MIQPTASYFRLQALFLLSLLRLTIAAADFIAALADAPVGVHGAGVRA